MGPNPRIPLPRVCMVRVDVAKPSLVYLNTFPCTILHSITPPPLPSSPFSAPTSIRSVLPSMIIANPAQPASPRTVKQRKKAWHDSGLAHEVRRYNIRQLVAAHIVAHQQRGDAATAAAEALRIETELYFAADSFQAYTAEDALQELLARLFPPGPPCLDVNAIEIGTEAEATERQSRRPMSPQSPRVSVATPQMRREVSWPAINAATTLDFTQIASPGHAQTQPCQRSVPETSTQSTLLGSREAGNSSAVAGIFTTCFVGVKRPRTPA